MKRNILRLIPLLFVIASCGTTAQYSQQRFNDSIYGRAPEEVRTFTTEEFRAMAQLRSRLNRLRKILYL